MHIIQPDFVATQLVLFDNFKLKLCEIFLHTIFCIKAFDPEQQHFMVQKSLVPHNVNIVTLAELHARALRGDPHS